MTWVRLDEQFARHPKVVAAGPVGMAMQVSALCYCNEYLTDGFVPHAIVPTLLTISKPGAVVEKLVEVGLWEKVDGGWLVHDFHDYQPTKVEVLALREARSAAGAKGGKAKAKGVASAKQVLKQNASNSSSKTASKDEAKSYPVPVPVTEEDTPAAEQQQEPSFGTQYAGTTNGNNGKSAAAEESPPEHVIRAAAKQFGSDFNVVEPLARQLTWAAFDALVVRMTAKVARGSADEPWALFTDLLQREIKAAHVAQVDIHIPTIEETVQADAEALALTSSPPEVVEELTLRKLRRLHVPESDHPRLLELAMKAAAA